VRTGQLRQEAGVTAMHRVRYIRNNTDKLSWRGRTMYSVSRLALPSFFAVRRSAVGLLFVVYWSQSEGVVAAALARCQLIHSVSQSG
jgi:hypothetical protein